MDKRENSFVPLNFPTTRNALWDYRATGPPVHLHAIQNKNVLISVSETPLRLLQRLAQESSAETYSCNLLGSLEFPDDGESIFVHVERLDQSCRPVEDYSLGPSDVVVACKMTKNCARPESTVDEYSTALKSLTDTCEHSSQGLAVEFARFMQLMVHCSFHDNQSSVILHLDCDLLTPTSEFKMTPVNPLPIVPTALSKNLSGPNGAACFPGQAKFGFLTMDQTRKLLLILASDPKVAALPLVGVWVSGVCGLTEPVLWSACMQYVHSTELKQRVCMPPEHFLLVVYSTRHSKPLFYQCCTSDGSCRLNFDLSSSHEVLQLPKNGMCRSQSPMEMDMALIECGPKRITFDAALQSLKDSSDATLSRRKSDSMQTGLEDITPRSKPMPHLRQAPSVRYSVPDVSLIEESFESPQTKRQSFPSDCRHSQSNALPHRTSWPSHPPQPMPMHKPGPTPAMSQLNMEYSAGPNPSRIPQPNSYPQQVMANPSHYPHAPPPVRQNPYQHMQSNCGYFPQTVNQHSGAPMQQNFHPYSASQPPVPSQPYPQPQQTYQMPTYSSAPQHPNVRPPPQAAQHASIASPQQPQMHYAPCSVPQRSPANVPVSPHPAPHSTPYQHTAYTQNPRQAPPTSAPCSTPRPQQSASSPKAHCSPSSENSSPHQNSTDSGLQVGNSDQFDDSIEAVNQTKAPPDVYELLGHQEKQLKELRLQIAQLLANQNQSPERKEAGIQSSDVASSKQTCSVASNTSLWLGTKPEVHGQTDRAVSPMRDPDSLNDTVVSNGDQLSNETLNFDDFQLAQIQERTDSFVSDMIVDMPAYSSTSPVKNDGSFASCSQSSYLSPQSVSMHAEQEQVCEDKAESSPEHLKDFYNALLGNVQKFLQQSDNEASDLDCSACSEPVMPVTDNSSIKAHLMKQRQNTSLHNIDKSIDVARMTKKQLENLGINLETTDANNDRSTCPDQSTFLLDANMLPKLNYRSLWLDSGDSDLSADADALAMKYLTDEQLSELARVRSSSKRGPSGRHKNALHGLSRVLGTSSRDTSMAPANQLSLCSRKYLERYGLLSDGEGELNAARNYHAHNSTQDETSASLDVSGDAVMNVQQFLKKMAEKSYLANVVPGRNGSVESSGLSDDSRSLSSGHGYPGPRDDVDSIHSFRASEKPTSTPAYARHLPRDRTTRRDPRSAPLASPTAPQEGVTNRVLDIDRLRELPKLL